MAGENSGRSFLTGLILGAVVGAAATVWLGRRIRQRSVGRGVGGKASEFAAFVKDELLGRAKEAIRRAVEEGREAARKSRSDLEERSKEDSEE